MDLASFNSLAPGAAAEVVRAAADVPAWVEDVVAGRPYASVPDLLGAAGAGAGRWTPLEVEAALAQHPRLGERSTGTGHDADLSAAEQSGLTGDEAAIAAGNVAYEEKFGQVFLLRAAGRTSGEVLEHLATRLQNDPMTEAAVVAAQLREIALLRLEGMVTP